MCVCMYLHVSMSIHSPNPRLRYEHAVFGCRSLQPVLGEPIFSNLHECTKQTNCCVHMPHQQGSLSPLYTELISLMVCVDQSHLLSLVFPLLLGVSLRNFIHSFLQKFFCRFMTLTTPTHYRAFNSQGLPSKECSSRLKAA